MTGSVGRENKLRGDTEFCYCGLSDAGQHVHGKLLGHVLLWRCWTTNLLSCVVSNVTDRISHRATSEISGWRPHAKSDLSASFFCVVRLGSRTTATNPSFQNARAGLPPWSKPSFQVSLFCTHQTNSSTSRGRQASCHLIGTTNQCGFERVVRWRRPVQRACTQVAGPSKRGLVPSEGDSLLLRCEPTAS